MGLETDFQILDTNTAKSYSLVDATGGVAPGGYGAGGNPTIGSFIAASLIIYQQDDTTVLNIVNVYNTLPTVNTLPIDNTAILFPLTSSDFLIGTDVDIPSKIVLMEYSISQGSSPFVKSKYIFLDYPAQCCLAAMTAKYNLNCGCDDEDQKKLGEKIIDIQATILAIQEAVSESCDSPDKARSMVEYLNKLCDGNCGCSGN